MSKHIDFSDPTWLVAAFGLAAIHPDLTRRLRLLADDLDALCKLGAPTPAQLTEAPLMARWRPLVRPHGVVLAGLVADHPTLSGPIIVTSPIWAIADDLAWVRTTSRVYRLSDAADFGGDSDGGARVLWP